VRAEIRVLGEKKAAMRFRDMAVAAENNSSFFRAAARILMRATAQRFSASPWVPLDKETIRQTARKGRDIRVLRATHTLEHALTMWGAPGQKLEITDDELTFGLTPNGAAYYGRFHQTGASVPKRKLLSVEGAQNRLNVAYRNHIMGRPI
jgi:hypothetical protein